MSESDKEKQKKYYPHPELAKNARIKSMEEYKKLWEESVKDPRKFWAKEAEMVDFFKPYKEVWTGSTDEDFVGKWFTEGKLNVAYNCLDRWVEKGYGDQVALKWLYEDDSIKNYTYASLKDEVSKTANALKELGADGLCSNECGCEIDDLAPCGECCLGCDVAKRYTKEQAAARGWDGPEYFDFDETLDWIMMPLDEIEGAGE